MSFPKAYGGHERSMLERYVVVEELLAAGAPVAAYWAADRQVGPLLLRFGSEEQKRLFLPRIALGECFFCLGMSEPGSGSDLASIKTRAVREQWTTPLSSLAAGDEDSPTVDPGRFRPW